ncbi:hypothetical protein NEIRO03_1335 [Nematocida sp. AWRm78]|nr:hypothetical protein NEIRO03_1335 [Nematocida sp. AWRm78]
MIIRLDFIIWIIVSCKIHCRIGINSYKSIHINSINSKGTKIRIDGSASPVRKFTSEKLNLMYLMRFFSPVIDIKYNLCIVSDHAGIGIIKANREFTKDSIYKIISEKKEGSTYIIDYHRTLLELFPSLPRTLSIYTSRNDSFIRFLRSEHISEHRMDILASLFLLAEGVDIPLMVEGSKSNPTLVLKEIKAKPKKASKTKNKKKSEECEESKNKFSLSMKVMCSIKKEDNTYKDKNVAQKRAVDVINFFIRNKTNLDIREGGKYAEPRTYEEFKTGKFLNNARWLIQYYIFEYLDSENSVIEFANAVYSMLEECIAAKKDEQSHEEVKYLEKILNNCFVESNDAVTNEWIVPALDILYNERPLDSVFPFSGDIDVPCYQCVPVYNRKMDVFINKDIYGNCAEAGLLSLFCCFAYDPATKEYTTEHMGEVSPDLKRFFAKYNKPFELTYAMYNEWSKVVADLDNKNIVYVEENRNEISPGIINMLRVVAEVTGRYSQEEKSFKEFSAPLEKKEDASKLLKKVNSYAEELFTSLSKKCSLSKKDCFASTCYSYKDNKAEVADRKIKVDILKVSINRNADNNFDIFGDVRIAYTYSKLKGGIELSHIPDHLFIKSFSANTPVLTDGKKATIDSIIISIKEKICGTLTEHMTRHCLEQTMDNNGVERSIWQPHPENISITRKNNDSYPIEKFFLYNSALKNPDHATAMMPYIKLCFLTYPLDKIGHWLRTMSNIIGNLSLINLQVLRTLFFNPVYIELYKNYFDKVNISPEIFNNYFSDEHSNSNYYNYLSHCNLLKENLTLIKLYLISGKNPGLFFYNAIRKPLLKMQPILLSILTLNGTSIDPLIEVAEFLDKLDRSIPKYKQCLSSDYMWLVWLKIAFSSEKFKNIIEPLFKKVIINEYLFFIHEDNNQSIEQKNKNILEQFKKIANKDIVCYVEDLIQKTPEYIIKLDYLLETCYI